MGWRRATGPIMAEDVTSARVRPAVALLLHFPVCNYLLRVYRRVKAEGAAADLRPGSYTSACLPASMLVVWANCLRHEVW